MITSMQPDNTWLIDAVRRVRPHPPPPALQALPADLGMAWSQVAAACHMSGRDLAAAVALAHGLETAEPAQLDASLESVLPERLCRAQGLAPLWHDDTTLRVAVSDPRLSPERLQSIRFAAGRAVQLVVMTPEDIETVQLRLFSSAEAGGSGGGAGAIDLLADDAAETAADVVQLAKAIFRAALDVDASDIHVHPFVGGGAIRYRVDGRMRRIATLPKAKLEALSRYFKARAGLDPNPMKPQDGRLRLKYGGRQIDVRMSILPAYDGDRIVCRLLDQNRNFSLRHGGFSTADHQALRRLTLHEAGIVLLTGPTGSGKTSTLYALLAELNSVDVNILTIEDPVEYVLPGISQIQADEKQGRSFAETLRAILRQDPDVVLIGEIRDRETAQVAAQAAITGHLVLSTLHTNDALGTLPRLLNLGLDPAILGDALLGVVSQRLVRKLCTDCRTPPSAPYRPGEEEFCRITGSYPRFRAVGCERCGMTGFRGRTPILEMFETSAELREAILRGTRGLQQLREALGTRHRLMSSSAKVAIVSGDTSPAEAQRAMGLAFWRELAVSHGVDPWTLRDELAEEVMAGSRLRILVVCTENDLSRKVQQAVSYHVETVCSLDAAHAVLDRQSGVMAVVVDARLMGQHTAQTLARWQAKTAEGEPWAGVPLIVAGVTSAAGLGASDPGRVVLLEPHEVTPEALSGALAGLLESRS